MTIDKICAHLQAMLDDKACHDEMTGNQVAAVSEAIQTLRRTAEHDKAMEEGRLVELPCKVGDAVKVDARTWGEAWNYKTTENGKYFVGEIVSIIKTKKQLLMKILVEHNVGWRRPMKRYPVSAIGKTVFLTRQEAEVALGGGGEDG